MLIFSLEVSNVYRMPDVDARLIVIFQEACQDSRLQASDTMELTHTDGENMRAPGNCLNNRAFTPFLIPWSLSDLKTPLLNV